MKNSILHSVAEDLFSTLPLIGRSIRRKLLKTALTSFNEDITPAHFEIMKLLEEAGTLHVAEIGGRLQIAGPQMTHLMDKLVDLNIVERHTGTEDRRTINIMLTNKGKTILEEHDCHIRKATRETLSCLTDEELRDLSASLRTLRDIFSKLE
ncbi:MarR family winged helix-turn-helix transcriptional regulator [Chloroflexota bacterium]